MQKCTVGSFQAKDLILLLYPLLSKVWAYWVLLPKVYLGLHCYPDWASIVTQTELHLKYCYPSGVIGYNPRKW